MTKNEPAKPTAPLIQPYDPNFVDWNQLVAEADEIQGYRLIKDDELDTLVGVPFIITRFVFRQGEAIGNGHEGFYISHEVVIAPEDVLSKYVDLSKLVVTPGEHVVFNDGSTGIYRQDVKYLAARGYIGLPDPVIVNGKSGESTFDLPPEKWAGINPGMAIDLRYDKAGNAEVVADVRISCPRGIRKSDYNAEGIGEAKTRYLG